MVTPDPGKTEFAFLPLGANLHTFTLQGLPLVLSLPDENAYLSTTNPAFFGETIGRVGNRIKSGRLTLNDGTEYQLECNNGDNNLHGGSKGWGKQWWAGPFDEPPPAIRAHSPSPSPTAQGGERKRVRFELHSPDGDAGFPGAVDAKAWYTTTCSADGRAAEVEVEYEVCFPDGGTATKGQQGERVDETVVNVTNHTAFSIGPLPPAGRQSRTVAGTRVHLQTALRQDVDSSCVPTGSISAHPAVTPGVDFELGAEEPVFDDCFVFADDASDPAAVPLDTRARPLRKLMGAAHSGSGVRFEAWSTEPAFQFYTGEYIDLRYEGQEFAKRAGFCVEASRFVDAAGKDEWAGMVTVKRGQIWGSRTVYKAWVE